MDVQLEAFDRLFFAKNMKQNRYLNFFFVMAEDLSAFLATNISFLKIFFYRVKNPGPRHENPEMKMQKISFL